VAVFSGARALCSTLAAFPTCPPPLLCWVQANVQLHMPCLQQQPLYVVSLDPLSSISANVMKLVLPPRHQRCHVSAAWLCCILCSPCLALLMHASPLLAHAFAFVRLIHHSRCHKHPPSS
jgi:hypothetical protein